jgi:hypothetical protein
MFVEHVATVWLLAVAPSLAHLAATAADSGHGAGSIEGDLYLFVMVIGGSTAMEAFRDRRSDGPVRVVAAVFGVMALVGGAWAYGSLATPGAAFNAYLRRAIVVVIEVALGIDLIYRAPLMIGAARKEARKKGW